MINKKGESKGFLYTLLALFMVLTIGYVFFQATSTPVAEMTNTFTANNVTLTAASVNSTVGGPGRANTTAIVITNATSGLVVTSNFSFASIDSNGQLDVLIRTLDNSAAYAGKSINVSYTYQPNGYVSDSAGQSAASLILVMMAIALVVISAGVAWDKLMNG